MSEMRRITLTKNHKEGDVQYYAGQTVVVPKETADWLVGVELEEKIASMKPAAEPLPTRVQILETLKTMPQNTSEAINENSDIV